MKALPTRIKPRRGFSHVLHVFLNLLIPIVLFVLVRTDFATLAVALLILSKWRMLAVRPRYWLANFRTNAVDILVGLSAVEFMLYANGSRPGLQLLIAAIYALWLVWLKPRSSTIGVAGQALIGMLASLSAFYLEYAGQPISIQIAATWLVCYLCARHFFSAFEEDHAPLLASLWGFFGASLAWVLGHWLLFYGPVAQIVVIIVAIGYATGAVYYLDQADRLTPALRRQFIIVSFIILALIVKFADWGDKTI